jgi:hypothetical protein
VYVFTVSAGCSGIARHSHTPTVTPSALVMTGPIDHLDARAREPMIVEHPNGMLFVSGYGEPLPTLWKSGDRGITWTRVNVGRETDGAIGNSDVDLAVARDGTLYFVTMVFDRKALEGTHISIGASKDMGATWSWTLLSKTRFADRPWVEVAPDGTAHVIWNDGSGVCHAVSRDGGVTWSERPRIDDKGGSSHLAIGPGGEVAVRVTPFAASGHKIHDGIDLIAVSTDGGNSWRKHPAPGQRDWSASAPSLPPPPWWPELPESAIVPRWVEPLAWDARGALYTLWAAPEALWFGRSLDRGRRWATWRIAEGGELRYYPYLIARGRGELAATWFSGHGDTLQAHLARLEVGPGNAPPRITQAQAFRPDSWRRGRSAEDAPIRDPAGEYLALTVLRDGAVIVVSPVQNGPSQRFGFSLWMVDDAHRTQ